MSLYGRDSSKTLLGLLNTSAMKHTTDSTPKAQALFLIANFRDREESRRKQYHVGFEK